ncbi:MAG TPA: nucleoside hydrolase [Planctomycetaceae bacterium]|nr:nucleoside hydrolase [Planctomycetaceae bacterium]
MAPQKVIIDADPGVGDALAVCLALLDPELDVLAVTGVGGRISAAQAGSNLWSIIEAIDPPKRPRLGIADSPDSQYELVRFSERFGDDADVTRRLNGELGLGDWAVGSVQPYHAKSSAKLMIEISREFPGEVTVLTLGPLTTMAWAMELDAEFPTRLKGLVSLAGTVTAPGDLTPAAEFNVGFEPDAARKVLRHPFTKTQVPLDVGNRTTLTFSHVQQFDFTEATLGSQLLKSLLSFGLRACHQHLGLEGFGFPEAAAIAAVSRPSLFTRQQLSVDVETEGRITRGMTVFDRRPVRTWRPNVDVLTDGDSQGLHDYVMTTLKKAT